MKRILTSSMFGLILACGTICLGQGGDGQNGVRLDGPAVEHAPSMSTDAWLYLQEQRRHDDPKEAVRRKAEFKGSQRANRLATMKWFGYSNIRPQASGVPIMGTYSPAWTGNHWNPYRWVGASNYSTTAIIIDHVQNRR